MQGYQDSFHKEPYNSWLVWDAQNAFRCRSLSAKSHTTYCSLAGNALCTKAFCASQTSHELYGSFAERDLQLKAFCASQTSHELYGSFAERDLQRKAFCASDAAKTTWHNEAQMHRMPSVAGLFPQKSHIIYGSFVHIYVLCDNVIQEDDDA